MRAVDWTTARLGEVAELVGGGTPSRTEAAFFGSDIDWVTPSDLPPIGEVRTLGDVAEKLSLKGLASSSAKELPPGTVLFSSRASIGKIAVADRRCCTNQGFANFVTRENTIDPWYLAFLLAMKTPEIEALAGTTTFKEVSRRKLRDLTIAFPSLREQRRIAKRVQECMERIDELRRLRESVVSEAKVIESAMFHDFVVEGAERNHWPTVSLGDITLSSKYGTSAKASADRVGWPVLRMGNIVDGYLDVSDLKYVQLPEAERAKYLLRRGDILINRTNSLELVGKAATFDRDGEWIYASYLVRIRVDGTRAVPEYVTAVINSRIGREFVLRTARRAIGMVNINAKEMEKFPIPLPPVSVQREFVERLAEVRAAAEEIRLGLASKDPELIRAAVLRKAFAGEL